MRGQAAVETALGVLLLTPVLLFGAYLGELAVERMRTTRLASEPLWDATAWPHHEYASATFDTPSATAAAVADARRRHPLRTGLFVTQTGQELRCEGRGQGQSFLVPATAAFYRDTGGARCWAQTDVESRFLPTHIAEGSGGFFSASLDDVRRRMRLCETDDCQGFVMLMDDWGLTNRGGEANECALTMSRCANPGFFRAGQTVYDAHRSGAGTRGTADVDFVRGVLGDTPAKLETIHDFQMSFRGEESGFTETVPVSEGKPDWATTPAAGQPAASYAMRRDAFLGK